MSRILLSLLLIGFSLSASSQIVINEVLYDPSNTSLEGDANGDGTYDQTQDEFIEIVNRSGADISLSRYQILDRVIASGLSTVRHRMDSSLVIPAGGCVVVFGGGTATGSFGGSHVEVDIGTQGLSMGNTGERVLFADSSGNIIDSLDTDLLSNNPDESYTRVPDIDGSTFAQHASVTPGKLFSPGTKADGTPFNTILYVTPQEKNTVLIWADPGNKFFRLGGFDKSPAKKQILDARGSCIMCLSENENSFSMQGFPAGVYTLRVLSGKGKNLKFVLH
jgi:hypothetical protein